jgi:hypothetical protein
LPVDVILQLDHAAQRSGRPTDDQWQRHWQTIVEDVAACDVLLFMSLEGERACSALIETGLAIAQNKPVLCVSSDWWSFSNLATVRRFTSLEPAIECLIGMAAGTKARLVA